jgi:hypothetical protein
MNSNDEIKRFELLETAGRELANRLWNYTILEAKKEMEKLCDSSTRIPQTDFFFLLSNATVNLTVRILKMMKEGISDDEYPAVEKAFMRSMSLLTDSTDDQTQAPEL